MKRFIFRSSMTIVLILGLLSFPAFSAILYVPAQYATIQQAIDAASNGDAVLVAAGTYVENLDFLGKAVTVSSTQGPDATVIDGNMAGPVVRFITGEGSDSCLDGFTVTNGKGGIYCQGSSPTIRTNTITLNLLARGAGVYCSHGGSPWITRNMIVDNKATYQGGGIAFYFDAEPLITDNVIAGNQAVDNFGGGIVCGTDSSMHLENNLIRNNSALDCGGIYIQYFAESVVVKNNVIEENTALFDVGGIGSFTYNPSTLELTGNVVRNNTAGTYAGGVLISISSPSVFANNLILNNTAGTQGGGLYLTCSSEFHCTHNTLAFNSANEGGGIAYFGGSHGKLYVQNSILWDNSASAGPALFNNTTNAIPGPEVLFEYSNVKGGMASAQVGSAVTLTWGAGMIDLNPLFVDGSGGDLHLTYPSPCRDSGSNAIPGLPATDFEGDPRTAYGTADMGADEFHPHLYHTGAVTPGGDFDLKLIGFPGSSPVALFAGSGKLDPPMHLGSYGDWYLAFPLVFEAYLGSIPSPAGVRVLPIHVPASVPVPQDVPVQAFIGSGLTNFHHIEVR